MSLNISLSLLQNYWWFLICILGGALVFMLFVQGGQSLIFQYAAGEEEKTLLINSLGRKWELSFTALVVFGGTVFASFPLFYAVSFGGAYWLWILLLFTCVLQAVSYEYRKKAGNFFGPRVYEIFLFVNGTFSSFLLGVIVATFFTGSQFSVDLHNVSDPASLLICRWENRWHGLEALANPWNIVLGGTFLFLSRVLGILYFITTIRQEELSVKGRLHLLYNAIPFLLFFIAFFVYVLTKEGLLYDARFHLFFYEPYKYLKNLGEMPLVLLLLVAGVLTTLAGLIQPFVKDERKAFYVAGTGVFLVAFSLLALAGFNHTAFYPSVFDMQSSLCIANASSGQYTLTVMAYVSVLLPIVAGYIFYAWKKMNNKPLDKEELEKQSHRY